MIIINKKKMNKNLGIVYLIQPPGFIGTDRYKIGCSSKNSLDRCFNYGKETRILQVNEVQNPFNLENIIKNEFNTAFKLVAGRELFSGNEKDIILLFNKIIQEYIEKIYNENSIKNNNTLMDNKNIITNDDNVDNRNNNVNNNNVNNNNENNNNENNNNVNNNNENNNYENNNYENNNNENNNENNNKNKFYYFYECARCSYKTNYMTSIKKHLSAKKKCINNNKNNNLSDEILDNMSLIKKINSNFLNDNLQIENNNYIDNINSTKKNIDSILDNENNNNNKNNEKNENNKKCDFCEKILFSKQNLIKHLDICKKNPFYFKNLNNKKNNELNKLINIKKGDL